MQQGRAEAFLHPPPANAHTAAAHTALPIGSGAGPHGNDSASSSGTMHEVVARDGAGLQGVASGSSQGASDPDLEPHLLTQEGFGAARAGAGRAPPEPQQYPALAREGRPLRGKHGALGRPRDRAHRKRSGLPGASTGQEEERRVHLR